MRITIFLCLVSVIQIFAVPSVGQVKLDLKMKNTTIEDVLLKIEESTNFRFFYQSKDLKAKQLIDVEFKQKTVLEILDEVLPQYQLEYEVFNNYIAIKSKGGGYNSQGAVQEQKAVSGKVTDSSGTPLPGVTVVIKGTTQGTVTNADGEYSLSNLPANATLQFSFVGMKSREVVAGNQDNINVAMEEETIGIDEVVAIGYGTVKKSDLTGSVVSVKADDIKNRPITTLGQAIQGKAPGVLVRTNSAAPGSKTVVTIRGQNSINSDSGPLYIVDGLPLSDISFISPEEIQSIEILKDGSSTAIYGSRGANGVILVTTKRGKIGKTQISYNFRTSFEQLSNDFNLMNAKEFTNVYTEWQRALNPNITLDKLWFNGSSADRPLPENAGNGTDWFKEITRSGAMNNHRININGGSESSTYSVSLHYLEHKGVILGSGFNRLGLNISNQFNILKWLNAGIDAYVASSSKDNSNENINTSSAGANTHSALHEAAKMSPATPVFNENGLYFENTLPASVTMENPIASAKEVENIDKEFNAFGKLFFEFNPVKNLKIKLSGGANRTESKSYFYNPTTTIYGKLKGGEASLAQNSTSYLINENTVSYNTIVNESHKFDVVAGFTYEQEVREIFANSATGFFTDFYKYNNLQAATIYGTPSSNKNQWQLASFISRINYIYQQKYLFTFTSRYDGSSKFGGDNKWGFFPSAAIAWRLSEESFMKQFKDLSNLKIRASIGTTGNSNIGLYQSLPSFGLANYPLGTSIQSGVAATRLENKELKWETTQVINFGIDVTFIQNINVVLDLYKKNTNDLLYSVPLIETSGYSSILRNVGSLENRGIEIGITVPIIDKGFSWSISGMFSMNRNEITKLTGDASLDWRIGNPLGAKRGYRVDGIINDQAELDNYVNEEGNPINNAKLGDWKIVDVNGDGKIDSEDMKNEIIFDPNPDFTYSISNDFAYKNFGLSVFIQGMQGNQILNANRTFFFTALDQVRSNLSRDVLNNYWTPDSKYDVKYARLGSPTYSQIYLQNGFAENGSFIKIQNISLSYQVPIKKVSSGMKIYLSAENVYTFTKYSGFDPDISSTTGNDDFGIDQNSYPMPRNYTFGIELTF